MQTLPIYVNENINQDINEGLIKGLLSLNLIKNISTNDFLNGILNMYEYICNEEDIKLFFEEFPVKERIFWKNLYELYLKKVWSIFDMEVFKNKSNSTDNTEDSNSATKEEINTLGLEENTLTKISVEMRRKLREIINDSKNNKLDLKPSEIESIIPISDPMNSDTIYFITINKTKGFFGKLFRKIDIKLLEKQLEKIGLLIKSQE